jgi:hypothetical protein
LTSFFNDGGELVYLTPASWVVTRGHRGRSAEGDLRHGHGFCRSVVRHGVGAPRRPAAVSLRDRPVRHLLYEQDH